MSFPRLHIVTDSIDVVRGVLGHGPVAVQIRVKSSDREAYALTVAALPLCRAAGALCLVDDRIGVALAAGADGVHVGADDLPVDAARRALGPSAVLGATCRNPADARAAAEAGASYLGVGPAFATTSKSGLPDPIGVEGVSAVVRAVPGTPVIAIAGITPERVALLDSYGVAAISAVAIDPGRVTVEFLNALDDRQGPHTTDERRAGATDDGDLAGRSGPEDESGRGGAGGGLGTAGRTWHE